MKNELKGYYRLGEETEFRAYLQNIVSSDINDLTNIEAQSLHCIFNGCAHFIKKASKALTAENLSQLVNYQAQVYQSMFINKPVIVDEAFFREGKNGRPVNFPQPFQRNKRDLTYYMDDPGGRMFNTAGFGFLNIVEDWDWDLERKYEKNSNFMYLTFAYISLPTDFLNVVDATNSQQLMKEFQNTSHFSDHDWFHNFLMGTSLLNDQLFNTDKNIPANRHLKFQRYLDQHSGDGKISSALNAATVERTLEYCKETEIGYEGYEAWAMRYHRIIMTHILDTPNSPVEHSISQYMEEWKKFYESTKDMPPMKDPAVTPAFYAARLLAYNLFRMAPFNHRVVQNVINDPDLGDEEREIFNTAFKIIYDRPYKNVLYEAGESYKWRKEKPTEADILNYENAVIRTSAHALELAFQDCQYVLAEMDGEFQREEPVSDPQDCPSNLINQWSQKHQLLLKMP